MKLLIFILLFFPAIGLSQLSFNKNFHGLAVTTSNASAIGVSNKTYTAGRLYLYITATTGTTNPGTISGTTSSTWNTVVSIGNSTRRIQIFRFLPTTTITGETVNIGGFGGAMSGSALAIWEISGADQSGTNGSGAIVQVVDNSGSPSADPSITLAAISKNKNAVISLFINDINPFGGTPESGWNEYFEGGYDDPATGVYLMDRSTTTDNTLNVTASSSNWIGVGIEIMSAFRRIIINH